MTIKETICGCVPSELSFCLTAFLFYLLPAFLGVFTPCWGVVCLMSLFSSSVGRMIVLIHVQHFLFEHRHYQHYKIHHQKNLIEQSHQIMMMYILFVCVHLYHRLYSINHSCMLTVCVPSVNMYCILSPDLEFRICPLWIMVALYF